MSSSIVSLPSYSGIRLAIGNSPEFDLFLWQLLRICINETIYVYISMVSLPSYSGNGLAFGTSPEFDVILRLPWRIYINKSVELDDIYYKEIIIYLHVHVYYARKYILIMLMHNTYITMHIECFMKTISYISHIFVHHGFKTSDNYSQCSGS